MTTAIGGTRQKLSMIASVTNQGKARWMIIDGAFNHERLIEFFESLIKDAGKKVFLILDNLGVHHCKPVKAWVADHKALMEVFYLPSYSPELNPEERLNADLKHVIRSKVPVRTKDKLQAAATEHMTALQTKPESVKSFFQDRFVRHQCVAFSVPRWRFGHPRRQPSQRPLACRSCGPTAKAQPSRATTGGGDPVRRPTRQPR